MMPGIDMFVGVFIPAFPERQNYLSSLISVCNLQLFQKVLFALAISAVQAFCFFLRKEDNVLLSTKFKRIPVYELTLQISLVLMRCVRTHIKVKHFLFNTEEEIRWSKLLRSHSS